MLYQTLYHPFIFTFNTFNSSSSPSLQVVETEMESVQGALKMSQNVVQFDQPASEDLWAGNGQQQAEEFCVDDLLDFSNDLVQPLEEEEQTIELEKEHPEQQNPQNYDNPLNNSSVTDVFASLSVPVDDLDNLEWLSHFVEDCEYSLTCPVGVAAKAKNRSEPDMTVNETNIFNTPVQTKARTKRSRAGLRVWSLGPASSTSSSSSASSTAESIKPAGLKLKKPVGRESLPRRCSHCGVQKTPQWRAGPLGVKTLCNACGVRYKSGRLLPEYRPACSPTFSTELHSNNHRKVLEMRQKKIGEIILS